MMERDWAHWDERTQAGDKQSRRPAPPQTAAVGSLDEITPQWVLAQRRNARAARPRPDRTG